MKNSAPLHHSVIPLITTLSSMHILRRTNRKRKQIATSITLITNSRKLCINTNRQKILVWQRISSKLLFVVPHSLLDLTQSLFHYHFDRVRIVHYYNIPQSHLLAPISALLHILLNTSLLTSHMQK